MVLHKCFELERCEDFLDQIVRRESITVKTMNKQSQQCALIRIKLVLERLREKNITHLVIDPWRYLIEAWVQLFTRDKREGTIKPTKLTYNYAIFFPEKGSLTDHQKCDHYA